MVVARGYERWWQWCFGDGHFCVGKGGTKRFLG